MLSWSTCLNLFSLLIQGFLDCSCGWLCFKVRQKLVISLFTHDSITGFYSKDCKILEHFLLGVFITLLFCSLEVALTLY